MRKRAPGSMPSLSEIVEYWKDHAPVVFPAILATQGGWDDPFCFRCGWWPPLPDDFDGDLWSVANGWLERAHLLDKSAGGPNEPFNLVPLCPLCHFVMPEYRHEAEPALEWVRAGQPDSRLGIWQVYTFRVWPGDRRRAYPGRLAFFSAFHAAVHHERQQALRGLERAA